ncbi:hypothetical protein COY32_03030, partial [candidate division WWE3 bacterium CG_4_10_14_0_2_um_filter_41_14]
NSTNLGWEPGRYSSAVKLDGVDDALQSADNIGGLVGWWTMDETSGASVADKSGNGYNGTDSGGSTITTGKFGNARDFAGDNDYIELPANNDTKLLNNVSTFSTWMNIKTVGPNAYASAYSGGGGSTAGRININILQNTIELRVQTTAYSFTSLSNFNNWRNYVMIIDHDLDKATLYVDGVFIETKSITPFTVTNTVARLGSNTYTGNAGDYYNGKMDDVRIYNRALSSSEISALYNQSKLSPSSSVSVEATVKPSLVGSTAVGGVVASKGSNYLLSTIYNQKSTGARSAFSTDTITSQLSGTSINDIFFYDTTTDTIDNSWRFDTTKSWYTETIDATYAACNVSTHDRCGTKYFPEKAYIVATNTNVYIYDAEENAMWMRFDEGSQANQYYLSYYPSGYTSTVFALNGGIYIGSNGATGVEQNALRVFDYVADNGRYYIDTADATRFDNTIASRNTTTALTIINTVRLLSRKVNDVHAAVINGKTYVAVATDGGVSVINETDGTVANMAITAASSVNEKHVFLTTDNVLYYSTKQNASSFLRVKYNASALTSSSSSWGQYDVTYAADQGAGNPTIPAPAFGWSSASQNYYSQGSLNGLYVTEDTSTIDGTSNTIYAPSNN